MYIFWKYILNDIADKGTETIGYYRNCHVMPHLDVEIFDRAPIHLTIDD